MDNNTTTKAVNNTVLSLITAREERKSDMRTRPVRTVVNNGLDMLGSGFNTVGNGLKMAELASFDALLDEEKEFAIKHDLEFQSYYSNK